MTRGIGMPVDVSAIDRELSELWRSAADAHASGELSAVVRACLVNLIIWAPLERDAERLRELAARLSLLVPARVVHVRAERGAAEGDVASDDSGIRAWISANCHLAPEGGKEICSEEVTIAARGRAVDEMPSVVLTLLSPDVPTALLVTGPLPARVEDEPALAKIAQTCDRLIVDSGRSSDAAYFERLAGIARALPARGTLGDLAWRRLSPWRRAIADEFDGAFAGRARDIENVIVEFVEGTASADAFAEGSAASGVPARLLLGWIASVLGWGGTEGALDGRVGVRAVRSGTSSAARDESPRTGGAVQAEVAGIAAVEFRFAADARGAESSLRIEAVDDLRENVLRAVAGDAPPRLARHGRADEEHLLARELRFLRGDRVYHEALALAARVPAARA
ncbi:MAG: glucose-6-phosphate dehydrogenase assembly protein OpcA [bacterium]